MSNKILKEDNSISVLRTIFPKSVALGATTWDKTSGGPVSIDVEVTATPVMDATGDDETFSFLGFYNFINNVTVRMHDVGIYNSLQIGMNGELIVIFSIPNTASPTQVPDQVTLDLGVGYITNYHMSQSFGSVSELVINFVCRPTTFSVPA